jgi:hypothetical protein
MAPPSSTSIYGTVNNSQHPHHLYHHNGPPPLIPPIIPSHSSHHFIPQHPSHLIYQNPPPSRSMTPASTYRINKKNNINENDRDVRTSSLIQSSMQSTPEPNKRDKVKINFYE